MYGLQSDGLVKVWKVYPKQYSTDLQVSVSHKKKGSNEYVNDYSGFIKCFDDAKTKAISLNEGDVIKITSPIVVTNKFVKVKNMTYTNVSITDFELQVKDTPDGSNDGFESIPDGVDENLPFE